MPTAWSLASTWTLPAAGPLTGLSAAGSCISCAGAGTIAAAVAGTALTRSEDLVAVAAAKIRAVLRAVTQIITAEFFADL